MTSPPKVTFRTDTEAAQFARSFLESYVTPAFGALSKSEVDCLVFKCLVDANCVNPHGAIFSIAKNLQITPARARNLVMNYQLRRPVDPTAFSTSLGEVLSHTRFSKDGSLITFGVESPMLREEIGAKLREKGYFADSSFSRDILRISPEALASLLEEVVSPGTKKQLEAALVKNKVVKDKSFRGIVTAVLGQVGKKIGGDVGAELASDFASKWLVELVSGRGKDAVSTLQSEDLFEA